MKAGASSDLSQLLTAKEAASFLRRRPASIYRLKKKISHIKVNGRILFRRAELERFLNEREVKVTGPDLCLPETKNKIALDLAAFDRLHLKPKGGRAVREKARRWNYGFGAVYMRPGKKGFDRWYLDYCDSKGRRRREAVKHARTRGEAVVALQRKVGEILSGKFNPVRQSSSMKFDRLADVYLEDYAKVKKRSWKTDRGYIEKSMRPFFKDVSLAQITPLDIEKFIKRRLEDGVTKTTVNRCLQILKRMFNLAIDWGYASENPVSKVRLFSEKDNLKERLLSAEEEVRLLGACPGHLRPIVIMALNSGMRRGELLGLRWANVDFDRRILKVEKTKSGESRFIEMNGTLLELLRRQRMNEPGAEFVFSNFRTRQPFVEVGKAFRRACRVAGIAGLRFHDLRHTFASRLIESGVDIITVKDLLGHSSVRITERYTHSRSELKRRAVSKLETKTPDILAQIWHKKEPGDQRVSQNPYFSMN